MHQKAGIFKAGKPAVIGLKRLSRVCIEKARGAGCSLARYGRFPTGGGRPDAHHRFDSLKVGSMEPIRKMLRWLSALSPLHGSERSWRSIRSGVQESLRLAARTSDFGQASI